jgi:hypothetical protein
LTVRRDGVSTTPPRTLSADVMLAQGYGLTK